MSIDRTGYNAHVPDLPGFISAGETRAEALQLLREAITLHLETIRRLGEPIPSPHSILESIEVEEPSAY
jgi:predicted RNase H-like HicB family nuclease